MAGRNFVFVPGPTNVPDRVMRSMVVQMEDHRSPKFPQLLKLIIPGLKKLFRTEAGTPFIFPSSGSGCWEAAITNTLSPGDKVLASNFGQYCFNLMITIFAQYFCILLDGYSGTPLNV